MTEQWEVKAPLTPTDFTYRGSQVAVVRSDRQGLTGKQHDSQRWLSVSALVIAVTALIVAVAIAVIYKPTDCSCQKAHDSTSESGIIQTILVDTRAYCLGIWQQTSSGPLCERIKKRI